jgi:hypothetical protein
MDSRERKGPFNSWAIILSGSYGLWVKEEYVKLSL